MKTPDPLMGIALMALASLLVPIVDGIAKFLSSGLSPFYIAFARYCVAASIVLMLTARSAKARAGIEWHFSSNALRTILAVGAMTCFFFAIAEIPLATAFGGYFLGPVIAGVLAAPLLHERITPSRLTAAITGLVGAYLIVRPGTDLKMGSLLAVLSGVLFAGYLVTTRIAASTTAPVDALRFQCVFGSLLLSPFAAMTWSWPTREEIVLIVLMGAVSATCHFLVIAAFRHAEAAVLSPLSYLELATATLFGSLVFAELPDALAIAGISLIVGSGLMIWCSERRGSRRGTARRK